jgi:hypothetical protein
MMKVKWIVHENKRVLISEYGGLRNADEMRSLMKEMRKELLDAQRPI